MSWAKIDDQFFYNKKVAQVDSLAKLLYIAGLVYVANQRSDGFIPERAVKFIANTADIANCQDFAKQLLDVCLWDSVDGGYKIHDYLEWNPTSEQIEATRAARKLSGSLGGYAKAAKYSKSLANSQTDAKQNPSKDVAKSWQKSAPSPSPSPSLSNKESSLVISEEAPLIAAAPPKSKPEAKTPKAPKPPTEPAPAAIQALHEIVGIYPPRETWDTLVNACKGKTKSDLAGVYADFRLRTPNKHNWTWVTEGVRSYSGKPNGKAVPNGLPSPETLWGTVQAEIDRVHYSGIPELPAPILTAIEAVGGWYTVCKADPGGSIPSRLRDAYRSVIHASP